MSSTGGGGLKRALPLCWTFFSDQKGGGLHLCHSHLSDPERLTRLLIATRLAYYWMICLGVEVVRRGWQAAIHRARRCESSLFPLGLVWLEHCLNEEVWGTYHSRPVVAAAVVRRRQTMTEKKVALITGANKGIGREIARHLGAQGMTVLVGARDEGRGTEAAEELARAGVDAHAVTIDVTDEDSIAAAADKIEGDYGRLDVLVNNAGIALDDGPASTLDLDTMRRTYETNVFGAVGVTQAMLPLLKKSQAGRIVNMSSGLGSLAQNSDPNWGFAGVKPLAYNSSKAALNMITVIFAAELKDTPIKVNAADPGFTATDLNQHRGTRTVQQGATAAVRLATLPMDGPTGGYFDEDGIVPW